MTGNSESDSDRKWKSLNSLQPHGLYIYSPWNSPGQNTGVGSLSLLQGIFPNQGSNPGLSHCRQILYQLSHKGSPRILERVAYPFSSGIFLTQESNWGLLHCRRILYQLSSWIQSGLCSSQENSLPFPSLLPHWWMEVIIRMMIQRDEVWNLQLTASPQILAVIASPSPSSSLHPFYAVLNSNLCLNL